MMMGIYKITNLVNNKIYIGSSINISIRWKNHRNSLNKNCHGNPHLQNAWNKYGKDSFKFEVIETIDKKEDLIKVEQIHLDLNKSYEPNIGYNICSQASSTLGTKRSKEYCERMSIIQKNRDNSYVTDEYKKNISDRTSGANNPMYGKSANKGKSLEDICGEERANEIRDQHSERMTISNPMNDRVNRLKISKSNGSIPFNVWKLSTLEYIGTWEIATECTKDLNLRDESISMCLNKKQQFSHGYLFAHVGEPIPVVKKRIMSDEEKLSRAISKGARPFLVYKKDTTELIGEWVNQNQCSRDLSVTCGAINFCLRGLQAYSKGYTFKYKELS